MLGLSSGLPYEGIVATQPQDVGLLVAWWDFTDINQLYQTRTSYDTAVSSDDDLIGRCKNKADTSTETHKIGTFIRARNKSNRPTYKTGGANGHSYALFDGSNTGLACRSESTDWGAHSTDILSIFPIINTSLNIWIIGEPEDNDSDGVDETVLSYYGYRGVDTSYADEEQVTQFAFSRDDDENLDARWLLTSDGPTDPPVSPNMVTATQSFSHWNNGETTIINIDCRTGVGGGSIYVNGKQDIPQTIFDTNSVHNEAARQEGTISLNNSVWDNSKNSSLGIGGVVSSTGTFSVSKMFEGKIYEILIYSVSTPTTSDMTSLNSYFAQKYNITLQ